MSQLDKPKEDVAALLAEVAELPDTERSLWGHNECVLIEFCKRLGAALDAQAKRIRELEAASARWLEACDNWHAQALQDAEGRADALRHIAKLEGRADV